MKNIFKNKIYFISSGSYPYGGAASNRALSYMRGLSELGIEVKLILIHPDKYQDKNSNKRMVKYKGINIIYTAPFLFVRGYLRKINYIIGLCIGAFLFFFLMIKDSVRFPVVILLVDTISIFPFLLLSKVFRNKVYHERTEYPFIGTKKKLLYNIYIKKIISQFNGIYVISLALVHFFQRITEQRILHLPMTVEFDRFHLVKEQVERKYLAYCGSMYTDKDGVTDLIKAFNIFSKIYPEYYLYLIGDNFEHDKFSIIENCIRQSDFKDKIICTGRVSRNEIPQLLKNAEALLLARPKTIQAEGGFPTKLGEYLATGNPVVITDVGEHSKYLEHNKSAFIAAPDNPEDFARKMIECFDDIDLAKRVGLNGYKVAIKNFNYKTQSEKLMDFLFE